MVVLLPEKVRSLLFEYIENHKKYRSAYVRTFMSVELEFLLEEFVSFMKYQFPREFDYFRTTHIYSYETIGRAKGVFMELLSLVQEFQDLEWNFQESFTEKLWFTILFAYDQEKKHLKKTMEDYPTMFDVDTDDYLGELEKIYQK